MKEETRNANPGQPTRMGPKAHFQRPAERHPRTREDFDERKSGSSPGDSLRGFRARFEGESKPDDCSLALSYYFDVTEHEGGGSGDEDGYVYVPCGGSPG